jgi:putative membrane protein
MNKKHLTTIGAGVIALLLVPSLRGQGKPDPTEQDKIFVQTASQSDFNEIKLSQLAEDKASMPEVKEFATRMVTDHTTLEQQMKPFADQLGVQPATSLDPEHQALYDKLSSLSGKDFDKEYIGAMDKDHHIALNDFTVEQQTTKNSALKKTVEQGRKVISEHTKMVDHLDRKLGMTPAIDKEGNQPG